MQPKGHVWYVRKFGDKNYELKNINQKLKNEW